MAKFKLDYNFKRKLEKQCQEKAKSLAKEARDKLYDKYISLIDWYYADYMPKLNKYDEPYYTRTFNLYNSAHKYYLNSHGSIFYGGVDINASGMHDYPGKNGDGISAERLLNKYIYTSTLPSATWHGGDWHGGYGAMAKFSIYDEIHKYRDELYKELQDRCKVKI